MSMWCKHPAWSPCDMLGRPIEGNALRPGAGMATDLDQVDLNHLPDTVRRQRRMALVVEDISKGQA